MPSAQQRQGPEHFQDSSLLVIRQLIVFRIFR